jgi:diguanylate cyclase (GGDEF)-like protein
MQKQHNTIVQIPTFKQSPSKKNVFHILFLCMVAFGLVMGLAFPPLEKLYFNDNAPISWSFVIMCTTAGITVGIANYIIFSLIVSRELRFLVDGMNTINAQISKALFGNGGHDESFAIEVRSNDILGEVTMAFNVMGATVEQRLFQESSFREIVSTLSANVDLGQTSQNILQYYIESTCITSGILYGKKDDEMTLLASHDIDTGINLPQQLEPWQGIIKDAIESGTIHTIDTEKQCVDWINVTTPYGTLRPKTLRLIPLIADQTTVGLVVAACGSTDLPESIQIETLKTYSKYMAPYLQNALLHHKIQEMASYDALTHVLNRRFGLIRLHEEFSTALRHSSDLSVIMLDIDKFKNINDTHGHEAGDMVLKTVASTIALNLRNEEVICRYGGEEFLIILPMANLNKAGLAAERLRKLVAQQTSHYKDKNILVTVSLGVSSLSSIITQNENNLINSADTALYHSKNMGRNQVSLFRNNESILLPRED